MTTETLEAPVAQSEPQAPKVLTAADRCDVCSAQAYVNVFFKDDNELYFCGHHYNKYEAKLSETSIGMIDERHKLLARAEGAESH